MVQLKVKSFGKTVAQIHISIPYGSIKSFMPPLVGVVPMGFQFLMVQLKVPVELRIHNLLLNFNSLWFN